jgi:hypothetical protein
MEERLDEWKGKERARQGKEKKERKGKEKKGQESKKKGN